MLNVKRRQKHVWLWSLTGRTSSDWTEGENTNIFIRGRGRTGLRHVLSGLDRPPSPSGLMGGAVPACNRRRKTSHVYMIQVSETQRPSTCPLPPGESSSGAPGPQDYHHKYTKLQLQHRIKNKLTLINNYYTQRYHLTTTQLQKLQLKEHKDMNTTTTPNTSDTRHGYKETTTKYHNRVYHWQNDWNITTDTQRWRITAQRCETTTTDVEPLESQR